jgi:inner membrane protein
VLVAYVGFQAIRKQHAIEFGAGYAASRGLPDVKVTAQPRPVSPFNWTVFVSDAEQHRFTHINLLRSTLVSYRLGGGFIARLDSTCLPRAQAQWETIARYGDSPRARETVRAAWASEGLAFFRWFAE